MQQDSTTTHSKRAEQTASGHSNDPYPSKMDENSGTWSEKFRISAKDHVAKEAAATLLEEANSSVLSQYMMKLADLQVSLAEMQVKASDEWRDYLTKMVKARE